MAASNSGSYRDTVREMMRDFNKKSSPPAGDEIDNGDEVPSEEKLLEDILDMVEENSAVVDDSEADALLNGPDFDEVEENVAKSSEGDGSVEKTDEDSGQKFGDAEPTDDGAGDDKVGDDPVDSDVEPEKMDDQPDNPGEGKCDSSDGEAEVNDPEEPADGNSDREKVDSDHSDEEGAAGEVIGERKPDDGESKPELLDADKSSEQKSRSADDDASDNDSPRKIDNVKKPAAKVSPVKNSPAKVNTKSDDDDDSIEMIEPTKPSPKPRAKKRKPEVVDLSSNNEEKSSSDEDEVGNPDVSPYENLKQHVDPDLLLPFEVGWRREVVYRTNTSRETATNMCDVYYWPPADSRYRTREAKRKRRSKADQERYFDDFPDEILSIKNFNYTRKPLGLNNAAYEVVRKSKPTQKDAAKVETEVKKTMKEVEETAGLLEESSDDEEVKMINGFDMGVPVTLQAGQHVAGMLNEYRKRKVVRDPETCCTPPLAEDSLWTNLDDDPFGVFAKLGGRSSPTTPPPLRAVKLTPNATAESIRDELARIRDAAFKLDSTKPVDLRDELASHDFAIRKFGDAKTFDASKRFPLQTGRSNSAAPEPKRKALAGSCTPQCPGSLGVAPSLRCSICKRLFHARCQGMVSPMLGVFGCGECTARSARLTQQLTGTGSSPTTNSHQMIRLKLPMPIKSGQKAPVELVVRTPEGRYQVIRFKNNSQVIETVPKAVFQKASTMGRTLYIKCSVMPKLNNRPVFLAVHPSTRYPRQVDAAGRPASSPKAAAAAGKPPSDQVSILVRPAKAGPTAKPVLLNVPRRVALKVKVGTTLSFSASSDKKYVVMDSKIHPPVGEQDRRQQQQQPVIPASMPRTYNRSNLASAISQQRPGLTMARGPSKTPRPMPGTNVLASGEIVNASSMDSATPCTPYCPGVTGFPDLECTFCNSLFHSKCVGIPPGAVDLMRASFRCKICTPQRQQPGSRQRRPPLSTAPQVGSVQVIDLD